MARYRLQALANRVATATQRVATDHIIALCNGGIDSLDPHVNRQMLCAECHDAKTSRDIAEYLGRKHGKRPLSAEAEARRFPTVDTPCIPVTLVCGPPGAGKSTYVRTHAQPTDLVIDLDVIASELSGLSIHASKPQWIVQALDARNAILRSLATDTTHTAAWFVIAAPRKADRDAWARMLNATIVLLDVPLDECIRRMACDPSRKDELERMADLALGWWETFNGCAR
jgi:5-methylcytosine-specific restriction protein A